MHLDLQTLAVTLVFVTALLGGLQIFSWAQRRSEGSLLLWGMAFLLISLAVGLLGLSGEVPDVVSNTMGEGMLVAAHGLLYSSARIFNGRSPIFLSGALAVLVWIVASESDLLASSAEARSVFISIMVGMYSFLLASEFRRMAPEGLPSSTAAVLLALAHGIFFFGGAIAILAGPVLTGTQSALTAWSAALILESIMAAAALAYLQTSIYKERRELRYKHAAFLDELTKVANRRAFFENGEAMMSEQRRQGQSVSLLLFDIDQFKALNDAHGHPTGDLLLQAFSSCAEQYLPTNAIFARLGGDEFAALLPATELSQAYFLANRIREKFRAITLTSHRSRVFTTVSAGVAVTLESSISLPDLVSAADAALYTAKANGRNQTQLHNLTVRHLLEQRVAAEERRRGIGSVAEDSVAERKDSAFGRAIKKF